MFTLLLSFFQILLQFFQCCFSKFFLFAGGSLLQVTGSSHRIFAQQSGISGIQIGNRVVGIEPYGNLKYRIEFLAAASYVFATRYISSKLNCRGSV